MHRTLVTVHRIKERPPIKKFEQNNTRFSFNENDNGPVHLVKWTDPKKTGIVPINHQRDHWCLFYLIFQWKIQQLEHCPCLFVFVYFITMRYPYKNFKCSFFARWSCLDRIKADEQRRVSSFLDWPRPIQMIFSWIPYQINTVREVSGAQLA